MKILMVAPTPFFSDRGTHIRILEEALALEKLGHQITIATYHIGKDIANKIDTKIDVRRIRRLLFWYKKLEAGPDWQKLMLDLMLLRKTFYLARTQKPDIIHGHLHEGILIGWIVQKLLFWRKMKLVADFHGSLTQEMLSHGYLKRGLKSVFRWVEEIIDRMGDYAIASSWEGAQEIKKIRQDGKVEVVLDGTNTASFKNKISKEKLREEMEIPQCDLVVGYTGGLVSNKGIDYFLDAIKLVLAQGKNIFFMIGGFPATYVQNFIRNFNLEKNVRLVSPLDYFELPNFLAVCDVAVDPKDADTKQASGKMLNYMGAGLPIVCFDTINNRNYLGKGGNYCKDLSGESLSKEILILADNPQEIAMKGEINAQSAKNFSWEKSANKINSIYDLLLKNLD